MVRWTAIVQAELLVLPHGVRKENGRLRSHRHIALSTGEVRRPKQVIARDVCRLLWLVMSSLALLIRVVLKSTHRGL